MQFSTLLVAGATFLTTASASGMFGMVAAATEDKDVKLDIYNGELNAAPACSGTVKIGKVPASGVIPCQAKDHKANFTWNEVNSGMAVTYTVPPAVDQKEATVFTYNVPNKGRDGSSPTYHFWFMDIFKEKRSKQFKA